MLESREIALRGIQQLATRTINAVRLVIALPYAGPSMLSLSRPFPSFRRPDIVDEMKTMGVLPHRRPGSVNTEL